MRGGHVPRVGRDSLGWNQSAADPPRYLAHLLAWLAMLLALMVSGLPGAAPAHGQGAPAGAAPPQGQTPPAAATSGLQVTAAATGEDIDPTTGGPTGGLEIELVVNNVGPTDAAGVELRVPIPARLHAVDPRLGAGNPPASLQGQALVWADLAVRSGERLGPFTFRLVPEAGADGAKVFRDATIAAQLAWSRPTAGRATGPTLQLNGLYGELGLRRTILANGLTIFTRERPDSRTVSIRIAIRAGSRDEDDTTSGGSHWLEHAHFLGTERREQLDTEIDAVGGTSNASTGWEHTDYWFLAPAENIDLMVDLLSDQMLHSTFLPEKFAQEKAVVFEELKNRNDTPTIRAFDEFINTVFQVSPLRRHPAGTIESVQSIPISTILSYRQRRYLTGNMAIAASGNLRHADAVEKIARAFAGLPVGARSERPAVPEPTPASPKRVEVGNGNRLAEIRLGWPAPGDQHDDAAAIYVLQDLLGTTGRRLSEEIRDRRALATSVDVDYIDFSDAGALMLSASTQPDRVDIVIEELLAQIRRVREGDVAEEEVQTIVRALAGRQTIEDEANQAQTRRAVVEVSGKLDSSAEYLARLRDVHAADLQRVANTYFSLENYTLVVVRN
jgi:predicted Zn-dependent peptidase